jgi:Uri superfamily endonuclease
LPRGRRDDKKLSGEDEAVEEDGCTNSPFSSALINSNRKTMEASRMMSVSYERRMLVLKLLRKKGRFLITSRRMLDDARSKYSNQTLKNKVDYISDEMQLINARIEKLNRNNKKNANTIKDLLENIIDEGLIDKKLFVFHKSKK